jgi:vitamin B12 transporter
MKTIPLILASSVLANLSSIAYAQTSSDTETITITGSRSPIPTAQVAGSVTVIDQAQIDASGAINMADLLRTVAGVNLGQTGPFGSLQELRFRGTESNHIMVIVDGVAINDVGQGSLTDFSHILLSNIEKIEVLRGPQSAIWGSNAIAGVISITTKSASGEGQNGRASIGLGNKGTYQASANIAGLVDKLTYSLGASTFSTDGQNVSRPAPESDEEDAYRNTSLNAKLGYEFTAFNTLEFVTRIVNYTADGDSFNFATSLVGDSDAQAKGDQISAGLNWHFAPSENGKKQGIYSQLLSFQYSKQASDNFRNSAFERSSEGESIRILWNNRFDFSHNRWLNIGLETTEENFEQRGDSAQSQANQTQSTRANSLVSDGLYGFNEQFSARLSYRYDINDSFDDAASYRLGFNYAINNDWHVFVSHGTAIKNPTFTERFGFFPGSFLGNDDLKPEEQDSFEAGVSGQFSNVGIDISWFNARLDNEILGFVFDAESGQFTAQNAEQESSRQGLEISLNGEFSHILWQAQYSYLDAKEGDDIEIRRARHNGSASLTYRVTEQHQVYLQADYSGSKLDRFFPPFPQPSQIVGLDPYWLLSANYTYIHSEQIKATLRVSNALDKGFEDVFGYIGDERTILLSAEYSW